MAEIGGYMGMLVGVSVMDVEIFVMKLIYFLIYIWQNAMGVMSDDDEEIKNM